MENSELQRRVVNYLRDRNQASFRCVEVKAEGEAVRLSGTVNSFYEKQLCLNACQRVAGVIRVDDQLAVAGVA